MWTMSPAGGRTGFGGEPKMEEGIGVNRSASIIKPVQDPPTGRGGGRHKPQGTGNRVYKQKVQ
jgi:hypothetical protein